MPKRSCKRDGRADHFGKIARGDGDFAKNPQKPDCRRRIMIAAGLREITSGGDAELDAQMLEQDRHEIRDHDDRQQCVTKLAPPARSVAQLPGSM